MEMKLVTAVLVNRFDVQLAEGDDGSSLLQKMQDTFTAAPGPLGLVFTERKSS